MKPYYEHAGITIYHGDCREILPSVKADVMVTDPPYGTGWYETDTDPTAALLRHIGDRAAIFGYPERLVRFCMALGRAPSEWIVWWPTNGACRGFNLAGARNESEHIAFFGKHQLSELRQSRTESSRRVLRANYRHPDGGAGRGLDTHGDDETRRIGDVWTFPAPGLAFLSAQRLHPNEKSLDLMRLLLGGMVGDVTLDPFMGSGTTLRAAKDLGRRAIGIDIEERYCEIAAKRMSQEVLPFADPKP